MGLPKKKTTFQIYALTPLKESLDTSECMNGEQRSVCYFAHAQDDLMMRILRMFEKLFSDFLIEHIFWIFVYYKNRLSYISLMEGARKLLCELNNHFVCFTTFEPRLKIWYQYDRFNPRLYEVPFTINLLFLISLNRFFDITKSILGYH